MCSQADGGISATRGADAAATDDFDATEVKKQPSALRCTTNILSIIARTRHHSPLTLTRTPLDVSSPVNFPSPHVQAATNGFPPLYSQYARDTNDSDAARGSAARIWWLRRYLHCRQPDN